MPTTDRSTNWSVTINMKNVSQERADEFIQQARQRGWIVNGQMEEGEAGTRHYQLHVKTPQVRFSALKRAFPTAHIEVARNVAALATYVQKEDTRIGTLPEADERYMTTAKLWDMIYQRYNLPYDKDGWNTEDDREVRFYYQIDQEVLDRDPLAWFDTQVAYFIRKGYYVDALATNPAIRSFWKKFYSDILFRSRKNIREAEDRQTDRQDELFSHEVDIPTTNGDDPTQLSEDEPEEYEEEQSEYDSEGESSDSSFSGSEGSDSEDD